MFLSNPATGRSVRTSRTGACHVISRHITTRFNWYTISNSNPANPVFKNYRAIILCDKLLVGPSSLTNREFDLRIAPAYPNNIRDSSRSPPCLRGLDDLFHFPHQARLFDCSNSSRFDFGATPHRISSPLQQHLMACPTQRTPMNCHLHFRYCCARSNNHNHLPVRQGTR